MDNEQFEKDRRNRWAQTRVIVDELKGIRKALEITVVLVFMFLVFLFIVVVALLT
jgi:flagellar biogenesis protein FliO